MPVNIFERAIQPIVDLDTDVVVYVPGYAVKGPSEPTLVTASNFTTLFGESPYCFKKNQTNGKVAKNKTYAGRPEKSWLYAKGLVDAGLTVLYHRCNPCKVGVAESREAIALYVGARDENKLGDRYGKYELRAIATNFGKYYSGLTIKFTRSEFPNGLTTVTVCSGATELESAIVSLDPSKNSFIGNIEFSYIKFVVRIYAVDEEPVRPEDSATDEEKAKYEADKKAWDDKEHEDYAGFDILGLDQWYSQNKDSSDAIYITRLQEVAPTKSKSAKVTEVSEEKQEELVTLYLDWGEDVDEFEVSKFEELLEKEAPYKECEDTERYQSITYVTTGGYYQTPALAAAMQDLAYDIKAIALVELPDDISADTIQGHRSRLLKLSSSTVAKSKSTQFVGADTFTIQGTRVVLPDGFGYLAKLGSNLSQSIPAWIPVANNPQGVVSAVATTRPISKALRDMMTVNEGVSINPIIYKQNAGYTIMGNRTLFPTDSVPGPDSYLNCQLVVNAVARSARRAANQLLIVSTNASTAFSKFKMAVSKTCDKMLVNGDGLAAYNITKLKKTQPGTIDILIELTVVEGLETFNIYLQYSLQLDE